MTLYNNKWKKKKKSQRTTERSKFFIFLSFQNYDFFNIASANIIWVLCNMNTYSSLTLYFSGILFLPQQVGLALIVLTE